MDLVDEIDTMVPPHAHQAHEGLQLHFEDIAAAAASEATAIRLYKTTHPTFQLADVRWRDIYETMPILAPCFHDFHPVPRDYPPALRVNPLSQTRDYNRAREPTVRRHVGLRIHFDSVTGVGADGVCIRTQQGAHSMVSDFDEKQHALRDVPRILLLDTLQDNSEWHACPAHCDCQRGAAAPVPDAILISPDDPPDDLSPDDASSPPSDDLSSDADSSPPSVDSDGRPTDPVSSKSGRRRVRRHARRAACARLMLLSASAVSPDAIAPTQPPSSSAGVAASPSLMEAGPPMHSVMDVDLWARNRADYAPGTYLCLTHGRTIVLGAYELDGHSFDGCEDCMCHAESVLRQ